MGLFIFRRYDKDLQLIDLNSIRNKDVREVDAEWLSFLAICQLHLTPFLERHGWSEDQVTNWLANTVRHQLKKGIHSGWRRTTTKK